MLREVRLQAPQGQKAEAFAAALPLLTCERYFHPLCFMATHTCTLRDAAPADYLNADAQPTAAHEREYQAARGRGDGRSVDGVIPLSRRGAIEVAPEAGPLQAAGAAVEMVALTADCICIEAFAKHGACAAFVATRSAPLIGRDYDRCPRCGVELRTPTDVIQHRSGDVCTG